MANTKIIKALDEISDLYDGFIVDIWGVVYDGIDPYPRMIESLNNIVNDPSKELIFLSNVPRPGNIPRETLLKLGINMDKARIYTSGDAVRDQLVKCDDQVFTNLGKKIYHLGAERNQDILRNTDALPCESIEDANFILLTQYLDEGEDMEQFDDLLLKARKLNIPAVCANPDIEISHGKKTRYCAGYFGRKYQEMGGVVHYYGKPDKKIFDKVMTMFNGSITRNKLIMIGDTMETDILGATGAAIDSLLLSTGNGNKIAADIKILDNYSYKPTWFLQS